MRTFKVARSVIAPAHARDGLWAGDRRRLITAGGGVVAGDTGSWAEVARARVGAFLVRRLAVHPTGCLIAAVRMGRGQGSGALVLARQHDGRRRRDEGTKGLLAVWDVEDAP